MAIITRDYLPIPRAKVDVERLFNVTRDVLSLRRGAIKGETLRGLILVKDYLRREKIGQI